MINALIARKLVQKSWHHFLVTVMKRRGIEHLHSSRYNAIKLLYIACLGYFRMLVVFTDFFSYNMDKSF